MFTGQCLTGKCVRDRTAESDLLSLEIFEYETEKQLTCAGLGRRNAETNERITHSRSATLLRAYLRLNAARFFFSLDLSAIFFILFCFEIRILNFSNFLNFRRQYCPLFINTRSFPSSDVVSWSASSTSFWWNCFLGNDFISVESQLNKPLCLRTILNLMWWL